ncbi:MAG TPA: hypothetical protein VIM41_07230 [Gammaproteobacteria bacterium]
MQRRQNETVTVKHAKQWLDSFDVEMFFINALVICVLLLTMVVSGILLS